MAQGVEKKRVRLATIKTKSHFVQVGLQMLRGNLMPSSHDTAFQQRERRLGCIGMDFPVNVNLVLVLDRLMFSSVDSSFDHCLGVSSPLVSNDYVYIGADIFFDIVRQCAALNILSVEETKIAAALADADNYFFALSAKFTGAFPADEGFIHLDCARQHRLFRLRHRRSNAMTEIPRCFVGNPQRALNLVCADSFTGLAEQKHNQEPRLQRQMRVVKNGVAENAELILAMSALMLLLGAYVGYGCALATWAFNTHRPTKPLKQFPATGIIRVKIVEVN